MKRLIIPLILCLSPPAYSASLQIPAESDRNVKNQADKPMLAPTLGFQPQPEEEESSLVEKIAGKNKFSVPKSFRLEIGTDFFYASTTHWRLIHVLPFVRVDYRLLDFIYLYAIIATQATYFSYKARGAYFTPKTGGLYTLDSDFKSTGNLISGGGLRLIVWKHPRVKFELFGQYQSLGENQADARNIDFTLNDLNLNLTEILKEHVAVTYGWRLIGCGAKVQFYAWRFRPYISLGYSWLLTDIKISPDQYAQDAAKIITGASIENLISTKYNETVGKPNIYIGTEIQVAKYLSFNIAGMAYPAKEPLYFAEFSIIISN